jgi:putative membrane protein
LFCFRGSALVRVRYRLLFVVVTSGIITIAEEKYGLQFSVPIGIMSLLGVALGIFLGFRTSASYDRFWEGRKLWGRLVNESRSLARHTLVFLADAPFETKRDLIYRQVAFVHALRMQLRDRFDTEQLSPYLGEKTRKSLVESKNPANQIVLELSQTFRKETGPGGRLSEYAFVQTMDLCRALTDIQGGCERIKSTPIPHSYTVLIHQVVALYVFILPFGVIDALHFLTPVAVFIIAYTFLGLDAVGDEIEDPFGEDLNDLPLDSIARTIEVNLREMLGDENIPELLKPTAGVLS